MTPPGRRVTYAEYRQLPDDKRYELVAGELLVTPAPSGRHQSISMALSGRLFAFTLEHGLGKILPAPTDLILSDQTVLQPDILFISRDRISIYDVDRGVVGAPDLVIEILSPSTSSHDLVTKRQLYSQYGVTEYWIVDPDTESVEILTQQGAGLETWQRLPKNGTLTSALLPGLQLDLTAVFNY